MPPNRLEIMVFAQINRKNDGKSKFNAEMITVFARPSLKKGENFGRTVSMYENKRESEVKKAIFSVEIWFFFKFFNFLFSHVLTVVDKSLQCKFYAHPFY